VISICFSWAPGPSISYFRFSLAVVTVCLFNTIVVAEKPKKKSNQLSSAPYWWYCQPQSDYLTLCLYFCLPIIIINLVELLCLGHCIKMITYLKEN